MLPFPRDGIYFDQYNLSNYIDRNNDIKFCQIFFYIGVKFQPRISLKFETHNLERHHFENMVRIEVTHVNYLNTVPYIFFARLAKIWAHALLLFNVIHLRLLIILRRFTAHPCLPRRILNPLFQICTFYDQGGY